MSETFRLTLAQLSPTVGDIDGNAAKARAAWQQAKTAGSDLVVLPEMFLIGYQPQDLVMRPAFWREAMDAVAALAADTADGPPLAIGAPFHDGTALYNAYHICEDGKACCPTSTCSTKSGSTPAAPTRARSGSGPS
jgi:NAD+ synthase